MRFQFTNHDSFYLYQFCLLTNLLSLLGLVGHQLLRPLDLHLLVVVGDVCWYLGLGHHEVQDLNPVLAQSADAGPDVGEDLLDDGEEESVVHLVDGVIGTENPAGKQSLNWCELFGIQTPPQVLFYSVVDENIFKINSELLGHGDDLVFLHGRDGLDLPEGVLYAVLSDGLDGLHGECLWSHSDFSEALTEGHHEVYARLRHSGLESPVSEVDADMALLDLVVRAS